MFLELLYSDFFHKHPVNQNIVVSGGIAVSLQCHLVTNSLVFSHTSIRSDQGLFEHCLSCHSAPRVPSVKQTRIEWTVGLKALSLHRVWAAPEIYGFAKIKKREACTVQHWLLFVLYAAFLRGKARNTVFSTCLLFVKQFS